MIKVSASHPITQPALVLMAGVPNVTFNAWRKRNNLFPRTNETREWKSYSVAELNSACLVANLNRMGLPAQRCVDIGMKMLPYFQRSVSGALLDDEKTARFIAIRNLHHADFEIALVPERTAIALTFGDTPDDAPVVIVDLARHIVETSQKLVDLLPTMMRNPAAFSYSFGRRDE